MNRTKKQMQKGRKAGLSNIDILRMKEIARKEATAMEKEAAEKAFLYMLAIPLNVLVNDYWRKTAKRRAKKFTEDVLSLYDSVEKGAVTEQELNDFLWDMAEMKVDVEWLKARKELVNHPSHYNIPGRKECIEEMIDIFGKDAVITFCELNKYKYEYRHSQKGGKKDLEKAEWYRKKAEELKAWKW